MSDHYGPWHSHDSAPQTGPYIGLADVLKKKVAAPDSLLLQYHKKRPLEHLSARAPVQQV